ncbi:MAG: PH domain-containing protein [Planctomycetota bacterium]|nr:PH domain-containing protein [Planctomycetota bacterium]
MVEHKILAEAEFTKKACTYWLLSGGVILLICVVTIPLLPFWFIFGMMITGKYLEHMGCTLTEKTLIVRKGMFNRIEKTIPLEKITDLGLKQGPIMRAMDLHALTVETAGSSGGGAGGALVSLIGIKDTIGFRNQVLAQRDLLNSGDAQAQAASPTAPSDHEVLSDIRDTLHRIEDAIKQS